MIAILNEIAGMTHSLVYGLPVGWLPFVEFTLMIVTGLSMLLTLLYFLRFNNWIGGLVFLTLTSCLWFMTPSVVDEVHQRQVTLAVDSANPHQPVTAQNNTAVVSEQSAPATTTP